MCATKKKTANTDRSFDLITEISFDEFRRPTSAKLMSEAHDPPGAMEAAIRAVLDSAPEVCATRAGTKQADINVSRHLSNYIDPYLSIAFTASTPDEKTLDSYRAAIGLFIDIVGDKPLRALSVTDQNRFEDMIAKIPANRTKIATVRNLTIDEMTDLDVRKLSPQSAKNVAMRTNRFLTWAFRREGGKPPFELMCNMRITGRSKTIQRRAFTDDELRKLFNPATYAQGQQRSPYMYWLPLIGLHSGMRINEIAQLALADIVSYDSVMCFYVTDDADDADEEAKHRRSKRVKTDAGRRIVPVHDALVSLGLLDYVRALNEDGYRYLFPELTGGRDGPGQPASKYFARYCDRVGLHDPGLVFHSFRHGAVGRMRTAGIAKELRKVVVGHSAAEDTHDGYGDIRNDFTTKDRKGAIETLRYENVLDYSNLKELRPTLLTLRNTLTRTQTRKTKNGNYPREVTAE